MLTIRVFQDLFVHVHLMLCWLLNYDAHLINVEEHWTTSFFCCVVVNKSTVNNATTDGVPSVRHSSYVLSRWASPPSGPRPSQSTCDDVWWQSYLRARCESVISVSSSTSSTRASVSSLTWWGGKILVILVTMHIWGKFKGNNSIISTWICPCLFGKGGNK